jgi:hypothetical protein
MLVKRRNEANLMEELEENTSVNVTQIASALKAVSRAEKGALSVDICLFCTLWVMELLGHFCLKSQTLKFCLCHTHTHTHTHTH